MKARKVAIVTGSTDGGAGRSIALALAREGFSIVVNNRANEAAASKVARLVRSYDADALVVHADITRSEQVETLVQETVCAFGRIDVLVINPGGGWKPCDLTETDIESARKTIDAEITSVLICCKYVLPVMRKQESGRIILIGMENTDLPNVPSWAPYDYILGKSSRVYLARAIADREKEHGITVNVICPSAFPHISEEDAMNMNRHLEAWTTRKNVTPQDIAEATVYLSSEAGYFVTGSVLQLRSVKQS